MFKCTDRGASTYYFKNFCPRPSPRPCSRPRPRPHPRSRPSVIWFVPTITLESLNQSEPNFHTWLISRQPQPSSEMGIAGHMQSPLTGGLPPPSKLRYFWFQPIQTKFPHMTFDWNSSSEFKNGHHSSNATPLIGGFCPIEKCLWTR